MDASKVNFNHIRQAAEWALKAGVTPTPVIECQSPLEYDQARWSCGTSCCIWGAACLFAGQPAPTDGPTITWAKSMLGTVIHGLLWSKNSKPEQFLALLADGKIDGADLSNAHLTGRDFSGTYLPGTSFRDARLRHSNFSRANLRGADFRNADLTGCDFTGADLTGANLNNATWASAVMKDAILTGVKLTVFGQEMTLA